MITRRDFLKGVVATSLAKVMGFPVAEEKAVAKKTKVILIRAADVIEKKDRINQRVIKRMLDEAVMTLTGEKEPKHAWRRLIKPEDTVGIKSNVWSPLPTPNEVEIVLRQTLIDLGVSEKRIGIDDRGVLRNPIFLKSTALINVRPLRTHHWSGVGGCIKNYIMFTEWPFLYHPDSCADLGKLWKLPIVKDKTRLNILLMLTPQFHTIGPHHFDPEYTWQYKGILVGFDPVAVDTVGVRILEGKRLLYFGKHVPIKPPPKHIPLADIRHGIGTSKFEEIELVKIGFMEDALV